MDSHKRNDTTATLLQECINSANSLIDFCELPISRINSIQEINSSLIVLLFENITGCTIPDLVSDTDTISEVHNVQAVIDSLSLDLLGMSLSHITGESIVSHDPIAISNFFEVLEAVCLHFFPWKAKKDIKDKGKTSKTALESTVKPSTSFASSSDENILPRKVLKRKICKKTLRKSGSDPKIEKSVSLSSLLQAPHEILQPHSEARNLYKTLRKSESGPKIEKSISRSSLLQAPHEILQPHSEARNVYKTLRKSESDPKIEKSVSHSSLAPHEILQPHSEAEMSESECWNQNDETEVLKPVREILNQLIQEKKQHHTQDVEGLYELNYEQRIQTLVLNALKSPRLRSQQMKRNYLGSLRSPMKRKSIPYCRKSFLLPYNLRRKPVQHSPRKCIYKEKRKDIGIPRKPEKPARKQDMPEKIHSFLEEFPGFEFPKNTLSLLTRQYFQHLDFMHKKLRTNLLKKTPALKQAEKTAKRQSALSNLIAKDVKYLNNLREVNNQKSCENRIKYSFRDARLRSAAMKKYFNEFHSSMKKKLQKRNFTEELIIQEAFQEMLKLQKEEVQLLCKRVKEADNIDAKRYRQYLCSLQNLYKDQLAMLTEALEAEHKSLQLRMKDQKQDTEKLHTELRNQLQKEVRSWQADILEMMKETHFRKLDAENFIASLQDKR